MSFSASWLALREPVDHRARAPHLASQLADYLAARPHPFLMDWGCGTGSNLRALAPVLGAEQSWTLVDYDPALLEAARATLSAWADQAEPHNDGLHLVYQGRRLHVRFTQADLAKDQEALLATKPDVVTAAALFDLCSPDFIKQAASSIAAAKAAFFTVLTYDGQEVWSPPHQADHAIFDAFIAHQKTDKGFGVSAGPEATGLLRAEFLAHGYDLFEADTPWLMSAPQDQALMQELAKGIAQAARETGRMQESQIAEWLHARMSAQAAQIGHQDLLALPRG
jgi:SAM-dependent methyltransferase